MSNLHEDGLTYTMTFSCPHASKVLKITLEGVKANKWFKICKDCGLKCNWSPKLQAWMSEDDWREYRNDGRRAAGLDPESGGLTACELYEAHRNGCDNCWGVDSLKGGHRCEEGKVLVKCL